MDAVELSRAVKGGTIGDAALKLEHELEAASGRGDMQARATYSNDLGVLYYLMDQNKRARDMLTISRDAFLALNDPVGRARALGNMGRVEEKERNRTAALALYQQAADLFHESSDREDEFATLKSLSRLYLKMGGWLQALASFDRGLSIKPHRTFVDDILHWLYQIPLRMMGLSSL